MKSRSISWPMLISVCVTALVIRLVWAAIIHSVPTSDFGYYFGKATGLVQGLGYTSNGKPTAFWPPGYPFFLAAVFRVFGASLFVAKIAGIALWTATTALAYLLGLRLGGRLTAALSGFIVALFPEFIFFANLTASENLFIPMSLGALLALSSTEEFDAPPSWKRAALAGLLLGCAILARSTAVLLPVVIALILVARFRSKPALVAAAALIVACAIPVAPWMARNAVLMGQPVLSTNGGISLWTGNNPLATGKIGLKGPYPHQDLSSPSKELATNSNFTRLALTFIVQHPIEFIALVPGKFSGLFQEQPHSLAWNTEYDNRGTGGVAGRRSLDHREVQAVHLARWLRADQPIWMQGLWALGVLGTIVAVARRRTAGVWIAALIGYWLVFHLTLGNGQPRYLVSAAPTVAIGAAFAAAIGIEWIRHRRERPVG